MITPVYSSNITSSYFYNSKKNAVVQNGQKSINSGVVSLSPISLYSNGNITKISFKGRLTDPNTPAIQLKVRGVSNHQIEYGSNNTRRDRSVENLANSNWRDGKKLNWGIRKFFDEQQIVLEDPQFGELGRVPEEVTPYLVKLLKKNPKDFEFQLSNVIAGTSKGAPTIGLRVNLLYTGNDKHIAQKAEKAFDFLLNSDDKEIKDSVMLYQPRTSPKEVLKKIFSNVEAQKGEESVKKLQEIISNISLEINDPDNKNILLLGHINPDGDTIGCVLALQAAIKANYPEKNVVCSIDDKIPGIYRDKLPGIYNITRPNDNETFEKLRNELSELKNQPATAQTKRQIDTLEKEISVLKKIRKTIKGDFTKGKIPENYNLVILLDVPSPSKFTGSYKSQIENADKVIYIDHHRERFEEWNADIDRTGINMSEILSNNLALVVSEVPAATQLVTVITDNAGLLNKTLKNGNTSKQFVAGIISGTSSDTGCFSRTANYQPFDMLKPVQERPNFYPEGLSKWLIHRLGNTIDKKWLRENIVYDLPDKMVSGMAKTPRQKMLDYCLNSQTIDTENGFGAIAIDYDQMYDIWETSRKFDRKITFNDVQNSIKYSEAMSALRCAPKQKNQTSTIEPYSSPFQDDKISALLIQDKQAGKIGENGELFDTDSIRMSFRSQEGTVYAEMLASLFGGGGHGSAAGGRITAKGVKIDSPISLKIDGVKTTDFEEIYNAIIENQNLKNVNGKLLHEASSKMHKFETILDEDGLPIVDFIGALVEEIRLNTKYL